MNRPFSHRVPVGLRGLPPRAYRSPYPQHAVDLSEPVALAATGSSAPLLASPAPNWCPAQTARPRPPTAPPPGRRAGASRPRTGTTTTLGTGRPAGCGRGVGARVRPGVGVGVGLDTDPHTDPIVCLSVQVSRYPAVTVGCCDRPFSGVSPGGDAYPYQQ